MSTPQPIQNLKSHGRLDPAYHFFALPVFAISVIFAIVHAVMYPSAFSLWGVVVAAAAAVAVLKIRTYALKVQDRVIRLEERLRLASLCRETMRPRLVELTEPQLIGLRFASDEEVAALAERALSENLTLRQIKEAIRGWRPDFYRV